jgi:outer membrane lipoprotein SlyB
MMLTLSRPVRALFAAAAISLAAAGCARQIGANTVEGSTVGSTIETYRGVVEQVRVVEVQEGDRLQDNTTGIALGGLAGGAAASRIGAGWGRAAAIAGGAVLGAAAGSLAERELSRQQAYEVTVQLDDGRLVTITQGTDVELAPGQRVLVQYANRGQGRARVIPA